MFALWFILGLSHSHPIIRIWLLFYLGSFWRNVNTLHSSGRRQISGAVIPIRPFSYKLLFKSCPSLPVANGLLWIMLVQSLLEQGYFTFYFSMPVLFSQLLLDDYSTHFHPVSSLNKMERMWEWRKGSTV